MEGLTEAEMRSFQAGRLQKTFAPPNLVEMRPPTPFFLTIESDMTHTLSHI